MYKYDYVSVWKYGNMTYIEIIELVDPFIFSILLICVIMVRRLLYFIGLFMENIKMMMMIS